MRGSFGVFLGVLAAGILVAGGHLYAPDDEVLFRLSQAIAFRGRLWIEPIQDGFGTKEGRGGRQYPQYGVGQAILAAPLLWLGEGLAAWRGEKALALAPAEERDKFAGLDPSEFTERFCASFFNAFVAAFLAAALFGFAARLTGDGRAAAATALTYGLATLALAHSRTSFTEPLATLFVFGSFSLLHGGLQRRSLGRLAIGGALAGASVLTRADSVVAWPALLIYWTWSVVWPQPAADGKTKPQPRIHIFWRQFSEEAEGPPEAQPATLEDEPGRWPWVWRSGVAYLAPMAAGVACVAALNWWRFGSPLEFGYSDQPEGVQFATPLLVGLHGLLFSPGRGLIFFSPPLILSLWAFRSLGRVDRRVAVAAGLLILNVLAFHAHWINWSGGWCWGPRHIFMIHVFLALTIAPWLAETRLLWPRRAALAVLFAIGFCVQIYGCSQDFAKFHRMMFATPGHEPSFRVLYTPEEEIWHRPYYEVWRRGPAGEWETIPFGWMGAPINDSLYIPQNSCWYGYAEMARMGCNDFLWLRLSGHGR